MMALGFAPQLAAGEMAATPVGVTAEDRMAIIETIASVFERYYPDPEMTTNMLDALRAESARGAYAEYTDLHAFTSRLTSDMRSVSHDDHITVWPFEPIPDDLREETSLGSAEDNYGFRRVELLPGNIGYIQLTSFHNPRTAGPTAIAAMNFVAHCDALIIDLRSNGGGDERMARFVSSYLFDRATHLTNVEVPSEDRVQQDWTLEWVPGPRMADVSVYILLNKLSYSSAEHLAFALQQAGRAVVVGERTRGGAHAVKYLSFPEVSVNIRVPYTTDVAPDTGATYVTGVVPDVPASTDDAFAAAKARAISDLLESETDGRNRFVLEWHLARYLAELQPIVLDESALLEYAGSYDESVVFLDCGLLFLQREGRPKRALVPLGDDEFSFRSPAFAHYRVRFTRDETGHVAGMYTHDSDGDSYPVERRSASPR